MKRTRLYSWLACISAMFILGACSTTKHLPEDELLYGGVKRLDEVMTDTVDASVREAVAQTLEVLPNSAFLGSAYHQSPFPFGLWIYNGLYTEKEKGLRHWLWNHMKSDPIVISQVNPVLRCRAAEVAMADEGYLEGKVYYQLVSAKRNKKKAKIAYVVTYGEPTRIGTIEYMKNHDSRLDSIIAHTRMDSYIQQGRRFSASALSAEKQRIGQMMVDSGYFNYSSNYVHYVADSTQAARRVDLRVFTDFMADRIDLHPCKLDSIAIYLDYGLGLPPKNFESRDFKTIGWRGRLHMKPKRLYSSLPLKKGETYRSDMSAKVQNRLSRLNTFKYNSIEWVALDTLAQEENLMAFDSLASDTTKMLMQIHSTYDLPWTGSLEVKGVYKDIDQVGPGISFGAQRKNLFGGGELLSLELDAGYEWNTGKRTVGENNGLLNSYEFGGKVSLSVPRLQLPFRHVDYDLPVTTKYSLSADILRRSGYFQMMKTSAEISYTFSVNEVSTHIITPIQLAYTKLMNTTHNFDSIVAQNPVLKQSFANQFIPSIRYTYIFDNRTIVKGNSRQWMQLSLVEAGGIMDAVMGAVGSHRKQGERQLLWQPFSQFLKASVDFRNYVDLGHRHTLATRLLGGIAYAYGNSTTVPYSEQFFIGGANSLRGFSIRSVGPGDFIPNGGKYSYMDQTGDVKLEANVEWRFPLSGDLYAALFADAGNVWTLRHESGRPGGQFTGSFMEQLATDTGLGLRYDLGMLVLRFDVGVPIHDPSESNNKYYNQSGSFFGNLGYHLAIGYPF